MPDVNSVHFDRALTNLSIDYTNPAFVADRVFPPLPVAKQSDKYFIHGKEKFTDEDDTLAPGAEANEIEWEYSSDSYFCEGHGRSATIPDRVQANADPPLQPFVDATEIVTDKIYLRREKTLAAAIAAASGSMAGSSAPTKWDLYTTSTPIKNVRDAKETVRLAVGVEPNTLLLGPAVWNALQDHPQITDRIKYSQLGVTTEDLLARLFGVSEVIIPKCAELSGTSFADIWGKIVLLFYKSPRIGVKILTLGVQFRWTFGGNSQGFLVRRWREEKRSSDMVEAQLHYDLKAVDWKCAYLYTTVVS